ncbi:MAG TPA: hypothetical protein VG890_17505 [Puia sp.]|nr:hypothetical protein [Puia sp.]
MKGQERVPDTKKILDYLNGSMTEGEKRQFESEVPHDPFLQDAVEGLQGLDNHAQIPDVVHHLNRQLQTQLAHRKPRKRKKAIGYDQWLYWSIGLIILLAFIGFLILRLLLKH